jgi:hypothetical protein
MAAQGRRCISKSIAGIALFAAMGCAAEATNSATGAGGSGPTGAGGAATGTTTTPTTIGSGGTGTTTGSGGGGGSAGGGTCALDPTLVVSDFELGTAKENVVAGRDGSWFLYNDKTATGVQTPVKVANMPLAAEASGACGSAFAFHTTAMGFTGFGAGAGVDFAPRATTGGPTTIYDGSAYSGISIYAKAATPIGVRLSVSDVNTDKEGIAHGGTCVDTTDRTNPNRCGDYFGLELAVTADWQRFDVPFAMMAQSGWGKPVPAGVDKTQLFTLRVQAKGDFDLWVDNVAFTR